MNTKAWNKFVITTIAWFFFLGLLMSLFLYKVKFIFSGFFSFPFVNWTEIEEQENEKVEDYLYIHGTWSRAHPPPVPPYYLWPPSSEESETFFLSSRTINPHHAALLQDSRRAKPKYSKAERNKSPEGVTTTTRQMPLLHREPHLAERSAPPGDLPGRSTEPPPPWQKHAATTAARSPEEAGSAPKSWPHLPS